MRTKTSKIFIGCDMDEIIADLLSPWINWYNKEWNDNLKLKNVPWRIDAVVRPDCGNKVYDFLKQEDVYKDVKPLDGALAAVEELYNLPNVDFTLITAAGGGYLSIPSKAAWVHRNLPFIKDREIMYASKKDLVKFDFFIDDSPANIKSYRAAWSKAKILAIAYPYNKEEEQYTNVYARDYKHPAKAWKEIVDYIKREIDA